MIYICVTTFDKRLQPDIVVYKTRESANRYVELMIREFARFDDVQGFLEELEEELALDKHYRSISFEFEHNMMLTLDFYDDYV